MCMNSPLLRSPIGCFVPVASYCSSGVPSPASSAATDGETDGMCFRRAGRTEQLLGGYDTAASEEDAEFQNHTVRTADEDAELGLMRTGRTHAMVALVQSPCHTDASAASPAAFTRTCGVTRVESVAWSTAASPLAGLVNCVVDSPSVSGESSSADGDDVSHVHRMMHHHALHAQPVPRTRKSQMRMQFRMLAERNEQLAVDSDEAAA